MRRTCRRDTAAPRCRAGRRASRTATRRARRRPRTRARSACEARPAPRRSRACRSPTATLAPSTTNSPATHDASTTLCIETRRTPEPLRTMPPPLLLLRARRVRRQAVPAGTPRQEGRPLRAVKRACSRLLIPSETFLAPDPPSRTRTWRRSAHGAGRDVAPVPRYRRARRERVRERQRACARSHRHRSHVQSVRRLLPVRRRRLAQEDDDPRRPPELGQLRRARAAQPEALHAILEDAAKTTSAPAGSDTQKLGTFYRACMDEAGIEKAGTAPIDPLLKDVAAVANTTALATEIAKLQTAGVNTGLDFSSEPDSKDSSQDDRDDRPGRPGTAGPRLLSQGRRAHDEDPQRVSRLRRDAAAEPRRRRADGEDRSRRHRRARDGARESDADARRAARSQGDVPSHRRRRAAGDGLAHSVECVLRAVQRTGVQHDRHQRAGVRDRVRRAARGAPLPAWKNVSALPCDRLVRGRFPSASPTRASLSTAPCCPA